MIIINMLTLPPPPPPPPPVSRSFYSYTPSLPPLYSTPRYTRNHTELLMRKCEDPDPTRMGLFPSWTWVDREYAKVSQLVSEKNTGDVHFREGRYREAIKSYSRAVELDSSAKRWYAIMYSNRAAAHMAIHLNSEAVQDCNRAVHEYDPNYTRAYLRRARAYRAQADYAAAIRDYRKYIGMSDTSTDELEQVNEELSDTVAAQARKVRQDQQRQQQQQYASYGYDDLSDEEDDYAQYFNRKYASKPSYSSYQNSHNAYNRANTNTSNRNAGGYRGYSSQSSTSGRGGGPSNRGGGTYQRQNGSQQQYRQQQGNRYHSYSSQYTNSNRGGGNRNSHGYLDSDDDDDDDTPNHYATLGVAATATESEIKKAYRSLALKYHPDKNKSDGAEDTFKDVGLAYAVLSDKQQKAEYDRIRRYR